MRVEQFREWLTDLWRPWHTSCLSEELALPNDGATVFDAEKMLRDARLGAPWNLELGVFQVLGADEVRRAAAIWSPITRLITEEVALAFRLVEKQRLTGEIVSGHNINRLTETLFAYFASMGRPKTRNEIRRQIDAFLGGHALPDAESMSPVRQPINVNLQLLAELRFIDKEFQSRFVDYHGRPATLHYIGLGLDKQLDDHRYDHCTPLNCRTFAGTGGDGVHFSLLVIENAISESSPIVITTPADMGQSYIVGESLRDFLNLGCELAYGGIEALAYQDGKAMAAYTGQPGEDSADWIPSNDRKKMLRYLSERLKLQPWTDPGRFEQLQQRFKPLLRYPPDAVID